MLELKTLVREKLNSGMTKQEAFDHIVSLNLIRVHDVATAVRDNASNFYKQKYRFQNNLLIAKIILVGIIQGLSSVFFPAKILAQTLPSDIFLVLTYLAIAFGVNSHYKLSFSAAIFLSAISIYMSVQNAIMPKKEMLEIVYYGLVTSMDIAIIGMSGFLYSKYFRGYDLKPIEDTETEKHREIYVFKNEN